MALQGTLDTFALPDVLRLLAATTKTGRLQISGDRLVGEVWLDGGNVVGGAAGDARTPTTSDVVFELLRLDQGSFEFVAEEDAPEGHDPVDVDQVIAEAEGKLADWRIVEAVVPSLRCHVTLVDALPQDEVTLDGERWSTLIAIGEGRTVAEVDARLDLGEIKVSEAVKALADAGIVTVGEPLAEEEPEPEADLVADEHVPADDAAAFDSAAFDPAASSDHGIEFLPDAGLRAFGELDASPAPAPVEDTDALVRAEVEPTDDGVDGGGSRDVDLDASLDSHLDHHSYLTTGEPPTVAAMPEPLPVADGSEPAEPEPSVEAPAVEAVVSTELSPWPEGADDLPADPDALPVAEADDPDAEPVEAGQLASLSPKAARAIAAAAAGPGEADAKAKRSKNDEQMNRNLLMKFISSGK